MKDTVYVTVADESGNIFPLAYLETKERHALHAGYKLQKGEQFVEVIITRNI